MACTTFTPLVTNPNSDSDDDQPVTNTGDRFIKYNNTIFLILDPRFTENYWRIGVRKEWRQRV